jgi:hypothetical protein
MVQMEGLLAFLHVFRVLRALAVAGFAENYAERYGGAE